MAGQTGASGGCRRAERTKLEAAQADAGEKLRRVVVDR